MVAPPPLPRRFEAVRALATGGTGVVLEAIDREGAVRVAFKILHPPAAGGDDAPDRGERLRREFAVAAEVRHPNLVRLGELHELDDRFGFSMELVDGPAVVDWVRRGADDADTSSDGLAAWGSIDSLRSRFLEGRVRTAIGQIAAALAALHGAGIVHRDLRPGNLRVDRGERADRVVVLDLGLAALADWRADPGARTGAVEYLAPEQVDGGRVTTASDLYGLGAVLFEIVTGRPPFVGAPADVIADKRAQPAPRATQLVPELARDLDELCARLLDRDPARRPSAADVAAQFGSPDLPRTTAHPSPPRELPLDGRDAELAILAAAIDAAPGPRPIVYVVHGPLGIGKTALLDRVARDAAERGALVCAGRCGSPTATRFAAWDSFVDGISRHLAGLDPAARAAVLPDDAAAITHLFPSFARVVPARPASGTVDELIERGRTALRALLLQLTRDHRLVAILDDAQAAGDDSLDLLCALLQPPAPAVVTLFAVRVTPASVPTERARMQRLAALPIELRFLPLGPLPPVAAHALATRLLGSPDDAATLVAAGAGNPLLLEQLAHAPGLARTELTALVAARVDAMPASARALVRVLAAAAGPVRHDVLGSALGLTHRTVVRDLGLLAAARLVRTTGSRRNDLAELHHDVVGDAARHGGALDPEHALLAAALDNSGLGDDRARLRHWLAAGDAERAGALAIAMVARARDSVGFTIAAAACDQALALPQPPGARAALVRARADALVGAGDAPGAAAAYVDAGEAAATASATAHADGDPAAAGLALDALDARRLAAEHLLRNGQLERGYQLAHDVAAALGFPLAMSSNRLVGTLLVERARGRLRGTALAAARDPDAARSADACASLGAGLVLVDPLRASWFTSRGVRAALDSGDPRRAARALALDACTQLAHGGPGRGRAQRSLALAEALVPIDSLAPDRDRADRALIELSRAAAASLTGDFPDTVARADHARRLYRDCSPRVGFEARTASLLAITASAWLGCWTDTGHRRRRLTAEAIATGDRYASVYAATGAGVIAELAAGLDPRAIRSAIHLAMDPWAHDRAPLLFAREAIALATCDLYGDSPGLARDRLADAWPALDDAHILHIEPVHANLLELAARAHLRCGDLDAAADHSRRLATIPWATGPALLLDACLAAHRHQPDLAATLLARAELACDAASLAAHATAARHRRAHHLPEPERTTTLAEAHSRAVSLGLGEPARAFAFLAPWPR